MTTLAVSCDHETFEIRPGRRTKLPVMIGIHSTALGPAIGGLRIKSYDSAIEAVSDVLRLSEAMTVKAAAIENGTGGGKTVVPLSPGTQLTPALKEAILLDVADHVHRLDGAYYVAPDVGTGPDDIDVIHRRTPFVGGYSKSAGGSGGTTHGTYIGVDVALRTAIQLCLGRDNVKGLRIAIVGLGGIGSLLAEAYASEGAHLIVSDVDLSRRALAQRLGAVWASPEEAMTADCDVLSPCALGGVLSFDMVRLLRTKVVCGAANNQLSSDDVAASLRDRDIAYVPDFIANAGGLMYASGIELHRRSEADSEEHTRNTIRNNVALVLEAARRDGVTSHEAALRLARRRLAAVMQNPM